MLDYQALAALHAVLETQSFQKAADKLFVTQSAISQRIKSLESFYGGALLIRAQPYKTTRLGSALLEHFRKTILLEDALNATILEPSYRQHISAAVSRDSLETWFAKILDEMKSIQPFTLEIIADDQDITLNYLKNGLVSACASTTAKNLSGCKAEFIGYFDYVLVASPEFKIKYFSNKNVKENLIKAPAIIFDNKDHLHSNYLKHFFNLDETHIKYNVVPSVAGFRQFAVNGYSYALIPEIDIKNELKQGKLIKLFPDKPWPMPVYWHSFAIESKLYKAFNQLVATVGKKILRQNRLF